mgnify:CR=1 FL=1
MELVEEIDKHLEKVEQKERDETKIHISELTKRKDILFKKIKEGLNYGKIN